MKPGQGARRAPGMRFNAERAGVRLLLARCRLVLELSTAICLAERSPGQAVPVAARMPRISSCMLRLEWNHRRGFVRPDECIELPRQQRPENWLFGFKGPNWPVRVQLLKTVQSKPVGQVQQYVVGLIFRRHSTVSTARIVAVIGVGGGEIAILQPQA